MLGMFMSEVTSPVGVGALVSVENSLRERAVRVVRGGSAVDAWQCVAPVAGMYGQNFALAGLDAAFRATGLTFAATGVTGADKRADQGSIQHPPAMGDRRFDPPV